MIAGAIAVATRVAFGSTATQSGSPPRGPCIYIANHSSHLDFVLVWSLLAPARRRRTRPVAARDYWERGPVRRWLAERVFRAILVDRGVTALSAADRLTASRRAIRSLTDALDRGDSLILFPEGTRNCDGGVAPFKSGLYHLCALRPDTPVAPVRLENLNRILPKGHLLPVPLLSRVRFGAPLLIEAGESKSSFLERCRAGIVAGGEFDG